MERETFEGRLAQVRRLAWKMAWSVSRSTGEDEDDVFQEICLRLWSAHRTFPGPAHGWYGYARTTIRNAGLGYKEKTAKHRGVLSLDALEAVGVGPCVAPESDAVVERVAVEQVAGRIGARMGGRKAGRNRGMLRTILAGCSLVDTARRFGVSYIRVYQIRRYEMRPAAEVAFAEAGIERKGGRA